MKKNRLVKVLAVYMMFGCATGVAASSAQENAKMEYDEALSLIPNAENGKRVYLTCAVCHRPEGWGTPNGAYPQIAGQLNTVIIKQLADIRARNRDNPIMYPFAVPRIMGGTQEMADVATYISQLPMTPVNTVGQGTDLEHGEKLYAKECVNCHGDKGQGDAEDHIPAIAGQHYPYLLRQFEWIKLGKRRNADPEMVKQIRHFSGRDIRAMMDYVSRLRPQKEKMADSPQWTNPDFPQYIRQ